VVSSLNRQVKQMMEKNWQDNNGERSTELGCSDSGKPTCQSVSDGKLPASVKVYPSMALRAMKSHQTSAYLLWLFARSIDVKGSGGVYEIELKRACLASGVHPKSYQRALKQAISAGYFITRPRKNGDVEIRYHNEAIVYIILGCEHVDNRACYLPTDRFIKGNWRSLVWEAFIRINFQNRIVSRATLYELTGINRFEQVRLEKGTSIYNQMNVAQTNLGVSHLDGVREFQHPSAFVYAGKVCVRLPDTRSTEAEFKFGSRTRAKIIRQAIKDNAGESNNQSISRAMRTGKRWRKKQHIFSKEINPMDAKQIGVPCVSGCIGKERMDYQRRLRIKMFFSNEKTANHAFKRYSLMDLSIKELFYPLKAENPINKSIREWKLILK
jgi:hypothetical protein